MNMQMQKAMSYLMGVPWIHLDFFCCASTPLTDGIALRASSGREGGLNPHIGNASERSLCPAPFKRCGSWASQFRLH